MTRMTILNPIITMSVCSVFLVVLGCSSPTSYTRGGLPTGSAALDPVTGRALEPLDPSASSSGSSSGGSLLDPLNPFSGAITSTDDTPTDSDISLSSDDVASISGAPLTHKTIVGAWTVTISDTNCQVFLALTRWSGGYRAASRGCTTPVMSDVQAWDIRDNRIVLVGSSGETSIILGRTGPERFEGKTSGGNSIMFTR